MKRLLFFIFLSCIYQHSFSQNKDIEELIKLNRDWLNAYVTKDATVLDKIFAPDFVLISPGGNKINKQASLINVDKQDIISVNVDSIDVRLVTNEVGILTAFTTFVVKIDGKDTTMRNCYQDVYIKRKNKWQAIAAHVTLLNLK